MNFLESIINSMVDRLDEKRGDFYRLRSGGICRLRMPAISWSEYLGRTASRKARSRQF